MSAIKIVITARTYGVTITMHETKVTVDGKFAYKSTNHPNVEYENLCKLMELLQIENTDIEVK